MVCRVQTTDFWLEPQYSSSLLQCSSLSHLIWVKMYDVTDYCHLNVCSEDIIWNHSSVYVHDIYFYLFQILFSAAITAIIAVEDTPPSQTRDATLRAIIMGSKTSNVTIARLSLWNVGNWNDISTPSMHLPSSESCYFTFSWTDTRLSVLHGIILSHDFRFEDVI